MKYVVEIPVKIEVYATDLDDAKYLALRQINDKGIVRTDLVGIGEMTAIEVDE